MNLGLLFEYPIFVNTFCSNIIYPEKRIRYEIEYLSFEDYEEAHRVSIKFATRAINGDDERNMDIKGMF